MKENEVIKGEIYIIRNNINDKVYIGQTIQGYKTRWKGHVYATKTEDKPLYNAMRKYGVENFHIELLEDNIPYEELDYKEVCYIEKYDCVRPNGYNISHGGGSYINEKERERMRLRVLGENNPMYGMCGELNPFYGKKLPEEARRTLSEKAKLRYENMSDEEKEANRIRLDKAREKVIALGGGFKGHNHTEEAKKRISEAQKGKFVSEETKKRMKQTNARKRKVVMLDIDGNYLRTFDSMTLACQYLKENNIHENPKSGEISTACKRSTKYAYQHRWIYNDDYINNAYEIDYKTITKPQNIICVETGVVYTSASKANKDTGCYVGSILACCRGKYKYAKDRNGNELTWRFQN